MKITNTKVQETANITHNQLYFMKNNNPRQLELIKKGMLYESIESGLLANELIKKDNKR